MTIEAAPRRKRSDPRPTAPATDVPAPETTEPTTPAAEAVQTPAETPAVEIGGFALSQAQLDELNAATRENARKSAKVTVTAPSKVDPLGLEAPLPSKSKLLLPDQYEKIVEHTFIENVLEEYERLEGLLHIGTDRGDYATVNTHLDHAEKNARRAFRLFLTARVAVATWEADYAPIRGAMLLSATQELQREKSEGNRNKTITDADVKAMASQMFSDEWRTGETKAAHVKAMLESIENLADVWKSRCHSLNAMIGQIRR